MANLQTKINKTISDMKLEDHSIDSKISDAMHEIASWVYIEIKPRSKACARDRATHKELSEKAKAMGVRMFPSS